MLPVAIFSCTGNSRVQWKDRNSGSDHVCDALDFIWGRILDEKRFMDEPYKKYLPFLVCIYEGGMMAYPLYTSLCGSENLSQIAVLDIAGLLFGFSVYGNAGTDGKRGKRSMQKKPVLQCIANPCFYRNGSWNYCRTDTNDHPASGQSFWQLLSQCGEYSDNGNYAYYPYCCWVQYGTCAGTYQPLPQKTILLRTFCRQ